MAQLRPVLLVLLFAWSTILMAQSKVRSPAEIQALISSYKKDPRGPFKDIRWFCPDGSTRAARVPCPEKNGVQHARYRDEVVSLAKTNQVHLIQILAGSDHASFWDASQGHSRIKQYQLVKFLKEADNGWLLRRARYYRGAIQEEDESNWGITFYQWLFKDAQAAEEQYFLIRQSARDVPHAADDNVAQRIRAASKAIADTFPSFMDLRVKIHGQPDATDLGKTRGFYNKNKSRMIPYVSTLFDQLIADLEVRYKPLAVADLTRYKSQMPKDSPLREEFERFLITYPKETSAKRQSLLLADIMLVLRKQTTEAISPKARVACLDLSLKLEQAFLQTTNRWQPQTLQDRFAKVRCLSQVAAATGFLEMWEWDMVDKALTIDTSQTISLGQFQQFTRQSQAVVEWGTGMVRAIYGSVVKQFAEFEPLANGFPDDVVRSSILLPLGQEVSALASQYAEAAGLANEVMGIAGTNGLRGLNPGYALGELVVIDDQTEEMNVSADKIYVFHHPPSDLKPIAGIATVTEGNLVSHVQLLARNLGIPNAVLNAKDLQDLKAFNGQKVFYAVSNTGTVILKPADAMTSEESELFSQKVRSEDKIRVPIEAMDLTVHTLVDLRKTRAIHSGIWCGPKAANLGELKYLFPDHVVEGLVLPFGLFRDHMDQLIPGKNESYWTFLTGIFHRAENIRQGGASDEKVEEMVLDQLAQLRTAIKSMPFLPGVVESLREQFIQVLGGPLGKVPVFLRSDTNMEDLKDFTGAGLNLTLFNVLDEEKIVQGIREVWASPYSERSYRWRQRYLLDPENVYPSILIIPSVDAERSGVMITKGVTTGRDDQVTVAFSKGVGGAVDGQSAESWLIDNDTTMHLLAPSRETTFTAIPATGGTKKAYCDLSDRLLTPSDLAALNQMAADMRSKLHATGPLDIELGILADWIWLFQVRPFVENKKAAASAYLLSISPEPDLEKRIPFLTPKLNHD
ncbi:MAG: phosphoenolpyruvate synthase [Saprospiraceae bacterium]|nr:phosphoenolpyruvate synthase [Saprospiraceae bacterium]